jgi:cytochrome P450/NADPH-cytochrome P450 reductase
MVNSLTTSVIVALKGVKNLETDGYIIQIGNGASVNTVRGLAAEKLDLALPLADIILETSTEEILTEIDAVRAQKVIYITFEERIKDVPGPTRYPLVGNLYDMMPDM